MNFNDYLTDIRSRLIKNHSDLLRAIEITADELQFRPKKDAWNIAEIVEHVGLTSHYLLILIDKAAIKAQRKADKKGLVAERENFSMNPERLDNIGTHKPFAWQRPDHMEPTGKVRLNTIVDQLADQLRRCLQHLEELKKGEGLFQTTTMRVNNLGRLNVYEYIDFLSQHVKRHLTQISDNLAPFALTR